MYKSLKYSIKGCLLPGRKGIPVMIIGLLPFITGCASEKPETEPSGQRPNFLIIMADDMGYSDLGCYGGEIHTPHLDDLASNGLRFTRFFNPARCCPTRASLLTGLYNTQAGIGGMTFDQNTPGYRGYIVDNAITIAEVLREAGYQTGMAGKWHVSNTPVKGGGGKSEEHLAWLNHQSYYDRFSPLKQYPVNRGFDKYYGNIWGVVDYFDPFSLVNGTEPVREVPEDYYHTDAINNTAAAYVRQFSENEKPFFLYVAHTAPHWPLHAPQESIEKYKGVYDKGWEAIRRARYDKMQELGIINPERSPLTKRWGDTLTWSDNPTKAWDARAMAVHAAMIDKMDQGIGNIIKTLMETGEFENTLIFFLSDNGASPEDCQAYGPGFDRPGETRSGEKIIYPTEKEALPGPQTVFASIGQRWANVANTPLKYWKAESFEGGVRTPLIAHWPEGMEAKGGSITDQTGHVMDFMATFIELANAEYPARYKGNEIIPLEGKSLVPILKGNERQGHKQLFNEHMGGKYARNGTWKLVKRNANSPWELYNMDKDRTESKNLAGQKPGKVEELRSAWDQWAKEKHVIPKPGNQ